MQTFAASAAQLVSGQGSGFLSSLLIIRIPFFLKFRFRKENPKKKGDKRALLGNLGVQLFVLLIGGELGDTVRCLSRMGLTLPELPNQDPPKGPLVEPLCWRPQKVGRR